MWEFNEYQTQLTDKVLASLNDEELAELEDVLTNVEFVKRLVSKDRKRAKDLDRDSSGRIIVDLSNPHILEDMDYFRESAIHFQKYGCYTKLMPNPNPQSEYGQWLRREIKRIWQGMTRASDGEWIPGDMYFYLNYFPIIQTKIKKGTKIGERVTDLPEVWEGVYWRFHYMHQARFGGLYDDFKGAHHGCEIARRGAAHPYSQTVITPEGTVLWSEINVGDKLFGPNGDITTVIDIPFDDECDVYKMTLKDGREVYCSENHLWNVIKSDGHKRVTILSLKEIENNYKSVTHSIPHHIGVEFAHVEPKIPSDIYAHSVKYLGRIPDEYKFNSTSERIKFVEAVADKNPIMVAFRCAEFAADFAWILRSIGYNCSIKKDLHNETVYYEIDIFGANSVSTEVINIEFSHREKSKCVTVDNESQSYLIGDFVQTHNSKSYTLGAVLTKTFLLGENEMSKSKVKSLALAYQKEYLIKDGLINKFVDGLTHCAKHTQFPSNRIKSSWTDMHWVLGFKNDTTGDDDGLLNEMIGVAIKDNSDKARGKRSSKMFYEEFGMFPGFLDLWQTSLPNVQEGEIVFGQAYSIGTGGTEGCLTAGNQVITGDGRSINIEDLKINDTIVGYNVESKSIVVEDVKYLNVTPNVKCVRIETANGRKIECTRNHPIYSSNKSDCNERRIFQWIESSDLKVGDLITVPSSIPYFGNNSIWDPRAVGLLIGDGSYGEKQNVRIYSCDHEIIDYFEKNYKTTTQNSYLTKDGKEFKTITIKGVRDKLREVGIYGQTKNNKRLPPNYGSLNKNDLRLIIAGLFDTDGNVNVSLNKKRGTYSPVISLSSAYKELLVEVLLVLQKFGIHANVQTKKPNLNKKSGIIGKSNYYSLEISDVDSIINFYKEIPLLIGYKIEALKFAYEKALFKKSLRRNKEFYYEKIISIEDVGEKDIYNLTTSGTHTYLANGIITHNSDFSGALEMINYPSGYNVYSLPNVYDRGSDGSKRTIFFFPGYVNSKGYYNKDGVSDVVGALISEIKFRVVLKYNSSDPMQLTKRKAETAFTLQDAIMRSSGTAYPADMLNDRINELNLDPKYPDSMWIGRLSMNNEGNVEYKVTPELKYITEFPHKDNKKRAAVCIKEQPKKDSAGKIPWGRYIAGADVLI